MNSFLTVVSRKFNGKRIVFLTPGARKIGYLYAKGELGPHIIHKS